MADGCNPGEPCYQAPVRQQLSAPIPEFHEEVPVSGTPQVSRLTPQQRQKCGEAYGTLGAGWQFLEKDEEVLSYGVLEAKVGVYRALPNVSFEAGFGYMPNVRNREYPDPGRYAVDTDTHGIRGSVDALFHLKNESQAKGFDPYVSLGGGLVHYDKKLAHGHTDQFIETGVGAFIGMENKVFIKPDYRIGMVGVEDTEVNQRATVSVGSKF